MAEDRGLRPAALRGAAVSRRRPWHFAPVAMTLAVIGILYGACWPSPRRDLKRLVAYTSVSHMGFVLLGVFAWNELALQGVVMEMSPTASAPAPCSSWSGELQERMHTRDMDRMGGLWATAPRMGGVSLFFALASLGLPGLGNFVGEFLVLAGHLPGQRALTASWPRWAWSPPRSTPSG